MDVTGQVIHVHVLFANNLAENRFFALNDETPPAARVIATEDETAIGKSGHSGSGDRGTQLQLVKWRLYVDRYLPNGSGRPAHAGSHHRKTHGGATFGGRHRVASGVAGDTGVRRQRDGICKRVYGFRTR